MEPLSINLLGTFNASLDGRLLPGFRTKATQALLIYLAVQPEHPQRREHLMALLWPGLPQKSAQANLRQTLYQLRQAIPETAAFEGDAAVPFLLSNRATVQINPEAALMVDVVEFERLIENGESRYETAVDLYQGDFLADFYLPDSQSFEEWTLAMRQEIRGKALKALETLSEKALREGDLETAETYTRRVLKIDNLRESVHRRLMRILSEGGARTEALVQYDELVQLLQTELGVEPSAETNNLYEQLRLGTQLKVSHQAETAVTFPQFLQDPADRLPKELFPFVGREQELDWLGDQLIEILAGRGRVAFVSGDAGIGKTSLLHEFAIWAQNSNPDLLVAWGNCNAFLGRGDAYLPFRDLIAMLTGDVFSATASGILELEQARRLWLALPLTASLLLEEAPLLVDNLLPASGFTSRLSEALGPLDALVESLNQLVAGQQLKAGEWERGQLFDMTTRFLKSLSEERPLLLFFDDLHWLDEASAALLFHLGRRLAGARILIVGSYRPGKMEYHNDSKGITLNQLLNEFRRLYRNNFLDLQTSDQKDSRDFIDQILDTEANRFVDSFREQFWKTTGGHPLLTIEILRDMRESGDIFQDHEGMWVESSSLNWRRIPNRVEAVIESRLSRLAPDLYELLKVAAVIGDEFPAQVIARVLEISERQILRNLTQQLEKQHGLVFEIGPTRLGGVNLFNFRFSHALFRQYLYDELGQGEKQLLHGDVAAILEELYAGQTNDYAVPLARHYSEAGLAQKSILYLLMAGDKARLLYAYDEAIDYYKKALAFLEKEADVETAARTWTKLGLIYHNTFQFDLVQAAYDEAFRLWKESSKARHARSIPTASRNLEAMVFQLTSTLDPSLAYGRSAFDIISHLFCGLTYIDRDQNIIPDLAHTWEILEKGRRYIFYLRKDLSWSDGHPLTAFDFEFAWKRMLDPSFGSRTAEFIYDIKNAEAFHKGQIEDRNEIGVRALDANTLEIKLERPVGHFLQLMAFSATVPVPKHIVKKHGHEWIGSKFIVTNGPFSVESWQEGESIVIVRNPHFHRNFDGNLKRVRVLVSKEPEMPFTEFENDRIDIIYIQNTQRAVFQQRRTGEVLSLPNAATYYGNFNLKLPPFDDPRVRRAFVIATNRNLTIRRFNFIAPPSGGYIPPNIPGHSPDINPTCDPNEARRLMAKAGFPSGRGFPEVILLPGNHPLDHEVSSSLSKQWRKELGVRTHIVKYSGAEIEQKIDPNKVHISLFVWWADYPDPDNFLRAAINLHGNWKNDEYQTLLKKASSLLDPEKRYELYRKADKILIEQARIIVLGYLKTVSFLVKPWVKELPTVPEPSRFLKDLILETPG